MFNIQPFQNGFGLDISDLKLRLLQLKKMGRTCRIHCFGEIAVPNGYIVEGDIKASQEVHQLLSQLLQNTRGGKLKSKYVAASLPERKTFVKVITIPKVPDDELAGAIKWEAQQHVPMVIDEVYVAWQILGSEKTKEGEKLSVLVGVAPKGIVDQYTIFLKSANLIPIVLETESSAIVRSLLTSQELPKEPILIVDIGASRTGMIIFDEGTLQFTTTHSLSGYEMTQHIAKNLKLSLEEAEKAKIICGLDPKKAKGTIKEILSPLVDDLVARAKEVIEFYEIHSEHDRKIVGVFLCGGVGQMRFLSEAVSKRLHLPVLVGNPLTNITFEQKHLILPKTKHLSYTTAIGLALRAIQPFNLGL